MTEIVWPEGTDLMAVLYTDGTNHLVVVQPPHSGQIPPPYIGTMTYQGQIEWPFGNGSSANTGNTSPDVVVVTGEGVRKAP